MNANNKIILDFLKQHTLAVIATVGTDSKPESAVVGISETEDLEVIFGTSNVSRKYQNLQSNPHVSFTIGWDDQDTITVQYEGRAQELSASEIEKAKAAHLKKIPTSAKFLERPDQRYFKVTPTWVRYSNFRGNNIFEVTF